MRQGNSTPAMKLLSLLFLATVVATSHAAEPVAIASGGRRHHAASCLSWRLLVETNNIRGWSVVPPACANYVAQYMTGHQYPKDCNAMAYSAVQFARSHKVASDGKDIWVFDTGETAFSDLPYYARPENSFGAKEFNQTSYDEWVLEGKAPALPAVLALYRNLVFLGYKIVFLSGKSESSRTATERNLKNVGYHTWEKVILKQTSEKGATAQVYKSSKRKQLEESGYRIIGNVGDQWSDLTGTNVGNRTFKVPNPMFYIA